MPAELKFNYLTDGAFVEWKIYMEALLTRKQLLPVVDGTKRHPGEWRNKKSPRFLLKAGWSLHQNYFTCFPFPTCSLQQSRPSYYLEQLIEYSLTTWTLNYTYPSLLFPPSLLRKDWDYVLIHLLSLPHYIFTWTSHHDHHWWQYDTCPYCWTSSFIW